MSGFAALLIVMLVVVLAGLAVTYLVSSWEKEKKDRELIPLRQLQAYYQSHPRESGGPPPQELHPLKQPGEPGSGSGPTVYQRKQMALHQPGSQSPEDARRQAFIASERAKMTASMRYDILARDRFRCQICGASQQDGVRLHVDHIVPVSRGGRTEPSNLRTLCELCNLGKRDKIEVITRIRT